MLVFIAGVAGCVSVAVQEDDNAANYDSLENLKYTATRIFGNCNIVVQVVDSRNANVHNSLDCGHLGNKITTDIEYCSREARRQYMVFYPRGILTLPLFPLFAVSNYISEKSADNDISQAYVACMEGHGYTMNGYGTYTFENGNTYQGNWKDGAFNGQGILYMKNGAKYDGQWKDGWESGEGFEIYADGVTYKGTFMNDMRNGYGVMTWPDGRRFDGTFRDNRPNGRGVFVAANGQRYEGDWSNGCLKEGDTLLVVGKNVAYCRSLPGMESEAKAGSPR